MTQRWTLLSLAYAASLLTLAACSRPATPVAAAPDVDWPFYGGDAGGQRYSTAAQITPANVAELKVAWTYSTGEMKRHRADIGRASFENTPILAGGRLYICSQFDAVSAVDPGTGKPFWTYDPKVDPKVSYPNDYICRGVSYWRDPIAPPSTPVRRAHLPGDGGPPPDRARRGHGRPLRRLRPRTEPSTSAPASSSAATARCRSPRRR
jgi:glucose dehydrogenase